MEVGLSDTLPGTLKACTILNQANPGEARKWPLKLLHKWPLVSSGLSDILTRQSSPKLFWSMDGLYLEVICTRVSKRHVNISLKKLFFENVKIGHFLKLFEARTKNARDRQIWKWVYLRPYLVPLSPAQY